MNIWAVYTVDFEKKIVRQMPLTFVKFYTQNKELIKRNLFLILD